MISTDFTKGASFSEKGNTYFWHLYFYPRNHSGNNCRFIFSNGSFCHDFFYGIIFLISLIFHGIILY